MNTKQGERLTAFHNLQTWQCKRHGTKASKLHSDQQHAQATAAGTPQTNSTSYGHCTDPISGWSWSSLVALQRQTSIACILLVNMGGVKGCFYSRPVDAEAASRDFAKTSDLATALLGPAGAELCRYGPIDERHEFELQRILRIRRSAKLRCCFASKRRRATVFQGCQTQESRNVVLQTRSAMHIPRQSKIAEHLC